MTTLVASPFDVLRGPIVSKDGAPSQTFLRFLYDLWRRTGQERGPVIFNVLSGANYSYFFEDSQGNLYITNNAFYNEAEGYWERVDETRTSWMEVFLGVSEPLEEALGLPAQTAGYWIAQPSKVGGVNNPAFTAETPTRRIKDGFTGAAGGWERGFSITQFGDGVLRGFGWEIDQNGNVPFTRLQGGFASTLAVTGVLSGLYRVSGITYNAYLDDSGDDRAKKQQARLGIFVDDSNQEPVGIGLKWSDAEDASAGDDEVGTVGPTWDQMPWYFDKATGFMRIKGDGTDAYFHPHDATTTTNNVGFGAQGNTALIKAGNVLAASADFNGIFYQRRGVQMAIAAIDDTDSPYTVTTADYTLTCDATSGAITVNLPAVSAHAGRVLNIKKIDATANAITVDGDSAETIDGSTTASITTQYENLTLQAGASEWHII